MSIRPLLLSALTTAITLPLHAQDAPELVRNGGFEEVSKAPTTYDQISFAIGWTNATLGLPEVFDPKAAAKTVGIPVNDYGRMEPQAGERYAGFMGWKNDVRGGMSSSPYDDRFKPGWNAYSEYLRTQLVEPLKAGKKYELVFHVALAGNSDRAIQGVGALVDKRELFQNNRKFIEEIPQVFTDELIEEKGVWREVRGTFTAQGDEQYLIIGIFPYVGLTTAEVIEGPDNRYAYFYIDGVSLKAVE